MVRKKFPLEVYQKIHQLVRIGLLAVRGSRLVWWKQLVALGILLVLGLVVVGLQTLAHSMGGH